MSAYLFDLQGDQENWQGTDLTESEIQEGMVQVSQEFTLGQKIMIAEIEHHSNGDFRLESISTEHFIYGEDTTAEFSVGGGAAEAAIDSIVPVVGTIAGALIGGGAGILAGTAASDDAESWPIVWSLVDYSGKFRTFCIVRVKENDENALPLGKYHIKATSRDRWAYRFIQPALGQSLGPLVCEYEEDYDDAGLHVLGPLESDSRPVLANVHHRGRGAFFAHAFSTDGTHQCILFEEKGQSRVEEYQTKIKPGKEDFFYIGADGEWNMNFAEGY